MYLMDGSTRIMISRALNDSDRLSSCNRGARRFLADSESLFNVYSFKTVEDEDTGGNPDEFLMRFNVGGVNLNEAAFRALQQEISLQTARNRAAHLMGERDRPPLQRPGAAGRRHVPSHRRARRPHPAH